MYRTHFFGPKIAKGGFIWSSQKNSAVLVDVGINRVDGKLYGDIEPNLSVRLQTPVPGGVGLLTRLAFLENLMEVYNKNN